MCTYWRMKDNWNLWALNKTLFHPKKSSLNLIYPHITKEISFILGLILISFLLLFSFLCWLKKAREILSGHLLAALLFVKFVGKTNKRKNANVVKSWPSLEIFKGFYRFFRLHLFQGFFLHYFDASALATKRPIRFWLLGSFQKYWIFTGFMVTIYH